MKSNSSGQEEGLTLDIQYVDWTGQGWTASRVGGEFLHSRTGDATAVPFKNSEIKYKDWNNAQLTARINNAVPTIALTSATAKQGASFIISQEVGSISDPDDPTDQLSVTVDSPNPSNGVTLFIFGVFSGQVSAEAQASCSASDTSFTLRVSDPGGASATGTLNVTVTVTPDNIKPVITVPAPITVNGNSSGGATVAFAVTATDNCGLPSLSLSRASGSSFPFGTTTVTATATDAAGNTTACSFSVTVVAPRQATKNLLPSVRALVPPLTQTQANQLIGQLELTAARLERGQTA